MDGKEKGAEEVSDLVQALSKLFRISLSKGKDIIPLSDEFEHVETI
ncbi:histidine kinase [Bacillus licheniformis]|nr:histidine kinase [Bacillus licheniformis]